MPGVNKEVWIDVLKESFYDSATGMVLEGIVDWSEFVENNTINYAAIGADPVVLKNNVTWPIVAVQRTDTALTVTLDTYDTTTTRVRNVEEIESSYDKLKSAVKQHKDRLQYDIVREGLWNLAPASNATLTPVITTTGATRTIILPSGTLSTAGNRMLLVDLARAQERLDLNEFPQEGRRLVLHPVHRADLIEQDATLFKAFMNIEKGQSLNLFGFEIMPYAQTPLYTKGTYAKKAFGAAADLVNDVPSSTFFVKNEVGKCLGDFEMFWREKLTNPEHRADEVGFQARAKVFPHRQSCIGAIVTARA